MLYGVVFYSVIVCLKDIQHRIIRIRENRGRSKNSSRLVYNDDSDILSNAS